MLVAGGLRLGQVALDGVDTYWSEGRPEEGGRQVVVRRSADGTLTDMVPPPFNARTRVHEYGGASFLAADGVLYFSNYDDQRLYRVDGGGEPRAITPEVKLRYADAVLDRRRGRLICVREDHRVEGREAVNALVAVNASGDDEGGRVLVEGNDFYSTPRISPDGGMLAWLTWRHPNMPWDGTELWVGEIGEDGSIGRMRRVAGGQDESVFEPEWSPDGRLYFVSDRTGWWNLYRLNGAQSEAEALCLMEAEFGVPQWVFGLSTYAFESAERIVCAYNREGRWQLASLNTGTGVLSNIETLYTYIREVRARRGEVVFVGGSPLVEEEVVSLDLGSGAVTVLRPSAEVGIRRQYISVPETVEFPTEGGVTAHGFFYAPKNPDFAAPEGEKPPLLVMSHGGPTSAASDVFDVELHYWTSRGIAVLDVNYGGSTGYGTEYRRRLNGQWGVMDVEDCANGALWLARTGRVDGERLIIKGWSAGGYTTLNALTFRDTFRTGASYFGIGDLEAMIADTHKFESRYLDSMIGPYPDRKDLYEERSALRHVDRLSRPVIFFQGLEDKVVPPNQAEMMVAALKEKGLPVAYIAVEGEQHGFRKAETIIRAIEAELYFYSKILGFELPTAVGAVDIMNFRG
jgi:dipeptidyl aminopeptidase/acylaminoacyl peptidase